jgi:RNA polymerase sigma-70 factor (ECF subfamily)
MTTAEVRQACPRPRSGEIDIDRDRDLVCRAQAGDKSAFDELYACYFSRLEKYCFRRLADPFEAQDVAQESFLRAWRALPQFAGDRRFYPWLSVIASNLCTDVLRRKRRFGPVPVAEPWERDVATGSATEDSVVASVEIDLAAKAFSQLSDRHKRVLDFREGSGMSYQEIADKEGIRITTVETLIWRARKAFKREYSALVDSDERLAAIIGSGALQAGLLKRVLRLAGKAPAKVIAGGPQAAATAVGSAVAATALVVAATSTAPHQAHSATPVGLTNQGAQPLAPGARAIDMALSTIQKSAAPRIASSTQAPAATGLPQTSRLTTRTGPSAQFPPAGTGTSGTVTGTVTSIVGTTTLPSPPSTKQVLKTSGGAAGALPTTVKDVVKTLEGTVSSTLARVEKKVGNTVGEVVGAGGHVVSGLSSALGAVTGAVTETTTPPAATSPVAPPASTNPTKTAPTPVGLLQKLLG